MLVDWLAAERTNTEIGRCASEVQSLPGAMAVFSAGSSAAATTGRMTTMPIRLSPDIAASALM